MAAVPTTPTRSHAAQGAAPVIPTNPAGPLTTGALWDIFNSQVRGQVLVAYNMALAQRGLTDLQIPGGEAAQIVVVDQATEIARPDLFLRVCAAARSRLGVGTPTAAFTTKNYFYTLHALNVKYSDNIRGKVNARYNQLLLRHNVNQAEFPLIPGRDLKELGLDGYEWRPATRLHTQWYVKAFADVVGERDRFIRFPALSEDESIMDRLLNMDPVREILSRLSLRDLAVAKRVCKAWWEEASRLERGSPGEAPRLIIGPIEAQFPSHQVIGPQFWAELKAMPSRHPDSAGHPGETIEDYLMRRRDALLAEAVALGDPVKVERLRCRAEGYMLDCQGTWTEAQVISLYQMMGSVPVEGGLGCGLVLKPKDYDFVLHMDILAALGVAGGTAPWTEYLWVPVPAEQEYAPSSGSVTLSALTNGLVSGTRGISIDARDTRVRALNCKVPDLLTFLINTHLTQVKTAGTCLYDRGDLWTYSLVQDSAYGRRLATGGIAMNGIYVVADCGGNGGNAYGVGAQRKFQATSTDPLSIGNGH